MSEFEIIIGLEVHVRLNTKTKLFSPAPTIAGASPNSQVDFLDAALPGKLPVLNKEALHKAVRFGVAVGATIPQATRFARKNYFYPDLPKGYQISQFHGPIVQGGALEFLLPTLEQKRVNLTRAHLEEDAGKSLHDLWADGATGIDLNRAGCPLLEIVTEPELRSKEEASAFLKTLRALVVYLGISDGNMAEGSLRADVNLSVRKRGDTHLNPRAEMKNLNSFRFVERAIDFESERQIDCMQRGIKLSEETRLFDPLKNETRTMRKKESALDYRYFPDPDLLSIEILPSFVLRERNLLPELPAARRERFIKSYQLSPKDAQILSEDKNLADYYEDVIKEAIDPKTAANWVLTEILGKLNKDELDIEDSPVSSVVLAEILRLMRDDIISSKTAKMTLDELWVSPDLDVSALIEQKGWRQVSDDQALLELVKTIVSENQLQVSQYKEAPEHKKERFFGFFVGQAMKATKGAANPQKLGELLKRELDS